MLQIVLTVFLLLFCFYASTQEIPVQLQRQLEQIADATEEETEDDSYWQQLEHRLRSPLNINEANQEELKELNVLSEWQIQNLLKYRQLLGDLVSVYELQAVPGWDTRLLRRLLPFITVSKAIPSGNHLLQRLSGGSHTILLRVSQLLESQRGFRGVNEERKYGGTRQRIFMRYRYMYKSLLQYGWSGDKDAGERFFRGAQRYGFDFNSFHLFARKLGVIEVLALGDFTVNMGQGLIQWQSLAFKKSGDAVAVKRQSPVLKPYSSAGEYNFHRGVGISLRKAAMELSLFASFRRLSANKEEDSAGVFVSSVLTSGYHRTEMELAGRNILQQFAVGASILYRRERGHVGMNMIRHVFSLPLRKRDEPYNLYSIRGSEWNNLSIDHAYTYRNIHLFGELAVDHRLSMALLQGGM
ncbi:MAG: helix-hairpin-helix domain-containing protein, partial [Chitinophagaceae bacterium]|nr:helix-hairpin-helix domain-containing protein [Chitinophagaceae bacterium]